MNRETLRDFQLSLLCLFFCAHFALLAQTQNPVSKTTVATPDDELKFVVIVTRHGVRSPTGKNEQLNQYSCQPWPEWSVPPGYLTDHGAKLMTLFGAYYRELYSSEGLVAPSGCADAEHILIVADSDQRTRETGKALAAGLLPGCAIEMRNLPEGTNDPLFHHSASNLSEEDKVVATAAVSGRIGANPQSLTEVYHTQIEELERILNGSSTEPACHADKAHSPLSLFDLPSSLSAGRSDHLVELHTPLSLSSTLTENLMLEYAEGMDAANVGWGRVDVRKLKDLLQLHTASSDITQRTPFVARAQSSNLLFHILQSMQQATSTSTIPGALNKPNDRLLIIFRKASWSFDSQSLGLGGSSISCIVIPWTKYGHKP